MDLFEKEPEASTFPLAYRARPKNLKEFIGQKHLLGEGKPLRKLLEREDLSSFLIWGPPGSGKTTIASIASFCRKSTIISATHDHIKDVKKIIESLSKERKYSNKTSVLIIDEIQHFNRKEQDAFLGPVERGDIILIALTTENPSFYINSALLSRLRVFVFEKLSDNEIREIVINAIQKDPVFKHRNFSDEALKAISESSDGDARQALNLVESVLESTDKENIDKDDLQHHISRMLEYGKEYHYDLISAFIKSMRGSDPDASLYYMYRMIKAGEDPLYIARRMIRFASEDVGLKDPTALVVANAAKEAFHFLGPPEGYLALAEACVYLAKVGKDNSVYLAEKEVLETINKTGDLPVPKKLRNPVTKLMEALGYGKDYKYAHNYEWHIVKGEVYLPEELKGKKFLKGSNS